MLLMIWTARHSLPLGSMSPHDKPILSLEFPKLFLDKIDTPLFFSGYGGCGGLSMEQAYGGQWPKAEHYLGSTKAEHYPDPYLVPALDPVHASHFQSRSPRITSP